jgi:perosamine synthetase
MKQPRRTSRKNSASVGYKEIWEVLRVLHSGNFAQGEKVSYFESRLSESLCPGTHSVVNSGTSALIAALTYFNLQPGNEVIVPSFTFAATANAVVLAGGTPVFADIDPTTYTISPADIARKVTPNTVGVIPVHLFGLCADMPEIMSIANHKNLFVVEDAAQAHLAEISGQVSGSFGDAGCFSFYPTKNMTSIEGGSIVSTNMNLVNHVRMIRNQGMIKRYENEIPGFNFRMTEVAAAVGSTQLKKLSRMTEIRKRNAFLYIENLRHISVPLTPAGYEHVYHQFTVRVQENVRAGLKKFLNDRGVSADIYYPTPVHKLKPYIDTNISLPETDQLAKECLSLPVGPRYREKDILQICKLANEYVNSHR